MRFSASPPPLPSSTGAIRCCVLLHLPITPNQSQAFKPLIWSVLLVTVGYVGVATLPYYFLPVLWVFLGASYAGVRILWTLMLVPTYKHALGHHRFTPLVWIAAVAPSPTCRSWTRLLAISLHYGYWFPSNLLSFNSRKTSLILHIKCSPPTAGPFGCLRLSLGSDSTLACPPSSPKATAEEWFFLWFHYGCSDSSSSQFSITTLASGEFASTTRSLLPKQHKISN